MSRTARSVAWAVALCLCSLVMTAPALAKTNRVTGGQQTVASSTIAHLIAFLRANGVTVTAIAPATLGGSSLAMPIVSGRVTTPSLHGKVECKGGVQFKKGNRVLRLRSYNLADKGGVATLSALVSGREVRLHRIALATMTAKVHTSGTTGTMSGGLKVTSTWAALVNQLLGKHVLSAGQKYGDLSATVHMA